jgi:hypothetical protein
MEKIAERVSLPLGYESPARRAIRNGLSWATVLPFLEGMPKREAEVRRFWVSNSGPFQAELRFALDTPELVDAAWHSAAREFLDWLIYDRGAGPSMLALLRSWTIDLSRAFIFPEAGILTCRFRDPDVQGRYGFANVPVNTLGAVRAREVAAAIHVALATDEPRRAPPPPIERAALDCLATLIDPTAIVPQTPGADPRHLSAALRQLCDGVPLLSACAESDPVAAGMAHLLNRVLRSHADPVGGAKV